MVLMKLKGFSKGNTGADAFVDSDVHLCRPVYPTSCLVSGKWPVVLGKPALSLGIEPMMQP